MNAKQRHEIATYLENCTDYDAKTLRITADGQVTAILDADKTFNGPHTIRRTVGDVESVMHEVARARYHEEL